MIPATSHGDSSTRDDQEDVPKSIELSYWYWVYSEVSSYSRWVSNSCGSMSGMVDNTAEDNFISEKKALTLHFLDKNPQQGQKAWLSDEDREILPPSYWVDVRRRGSHTGSKNLDILGRVRLSWRWRGNGTEMNDKFWVARNLPADVIFGRIQGDNVALNTTSVLRSGMGQDMRPCKKRCETW